MLLVWEAKPPTPEHNMTNAYRTVAIKYSADVFTSERFAFSFAARSQKFNRVVLGESGEFLVVCNADAMRLVRAGYELA